jgi:two-component system LytT family sensor kinase
MGNMSWDNFISKRENQFLVLQLAGWSAWVLIYVLQDLRFPQWEGYPVPVLVFCAAVGMALTYLLRYVYRAVWEKSAFIKAMTFAVMSFVVASIWQACKNYAIFTYQDKLTGELAEHSYIAVLTSGLIQASYFVLLGWSALYFGIKYYQLLQEEQKKSIRAHAMAHEAQLRMLRYQLNPHFLFNTLNAISTLILSSELNTANSMLTKLSNFLRFSLDNDPLQKVTLEHEISTMNLYLAIEQVRFEDRLNVEIDIDPSAIRALVPSLLLQPLVENSIKYAVAASETGGTISIKARVFSQELLMEVSDTGPGINLEDRASPEFRGVGIRNTRERLKEMYGDDHACKFGMAEPSGLIVSIRIPFQLEQDG